MEINNIEMISFRNHEKTNISFNSGLTVIWGKNGSGKTSILEAIHGLSIGKSFKTNNKKELIKDGSTGFFLKGIFKNEEEEINRVSFSQNILGNKKIKINEKEIVKRKEMLGINNVVVFSPEENEIIKGPPVERRKFFNKVFSICCPQYLDTLLCYNKILKQRNTVLKQQKKRESELYSWNEVISTYGQKLWVERNKQLTTFKKVFKTTTKAFDKKINIKIKRKKENVNKEQILKQLLKNEEKDRQRGYTSFGPHKDDFVFLWNNKPIRKHGSQGEIKLFLALLKITEHIYLYKKTKKKPIFLIDDMFASLDQKRSKKLLSFIDKMQKKEFSKPQTIITTTDIIDIEKNGFFTGFNKIEKHHLINNANT
tara:strand:- start:109 stop:1215 length:1107 start_codon:yes stop_codon:yes gene_type:complete